MANFAIETVTTPVGAIQIHCSDTGIRELKIRWNLRSGWNGENRGNREFRGAGRGQNSANNKRTPAAKIAARAKDELQQVLFNKIVNGDLQTPYTWETELSALGQLNFDSDEAKAIAFRAKW